MAPLVVSGVNEIIMYANEIVNVYVTPAGQRTEDTQTRGKME